MLWWSSGDCRTLGDAAAWVDCWRIAWRLDAGGLVHWSAQAGNWWETGMHQSSPSFIIFVSMHIMFAYWEGMVHQWIHRHFYASGEILTKMLLAVDISDLDFIQKVLQGLVVSRSWLRAFHQALAFIQPGLQLLKLFSVPFQLLPAILKPKWSRMAKTRSYEAWRTLYIHHGYINHFIHMMTLDIFKGWECTSIWGTLLMRKWLRVHNNSPCAPFFCKWDLFPQNQDKVARNTWWFCINFQGVSRVFII